MEPEDQVGLWVPQLRVEAPGIAPGVAVFIPNGNIQVHVGVR